MLLLFLASDPLNHLLGRPRWRLGIPTCLAKGAAKRGRKRSRGFARGPLQSPSPTSVSSSSPTGVDDEQPLSPSRKEEWEEVNAEILDDNDLDEVAGVLPEVVSQRMLRRLLVLGGIPFGLFLAFFGGYAVLAFKFDIRVLPSVVAYSTLGTVGLAGMGLTYGIMSASWDPEVEGSLVGWEEAKLNLKRAYDGVKKALAKEKQ